LDDDDGLDNARFELIVDLDSTGLENVRLELARLVAIYGGHIQEFRIDEPEDSAAENTATPGNSATTE
jgi:hypothetical protein